MNKKILTAIAVFGLSYLAVKSFSTAEEDDPNLPAGGNDGSGTNTGGGSSSGGSGNSGGGSSTFNESYWQQIFEDSMVSCWVTCDHRYNALSLIYDTLTDQDLLVLSNTIVQAHGKKMWQIMDTYDLYGGPYFYNKASYLYDKLKNLNA